MVDYDCKDIRNFYFEDETGKRIDCQKVNGNLFLYNVSGLGYKENIEYERIGNTFVQSNKELMQNTITGDLEFYDMSYEEYCNFVDFILAATSLRLIYVPKTNNRVEFYRDIDVCEIDKTEEDEYNILACPITMKCKSLWYKENTTVYTIEPVDNEIRWDFIWDSRFTDYNTRSLNYINLGHTEAPVLIEIDGHITNPKIELYVEGELYQTVTFNIEIQEFEKLLYGTKENDFYINKQKTNGTIESLFDLDVIDFNNDNVIRLPKNKSCELRITADDEVLNAKVTILAYYKAV